MFRFSLAQVKFSEKAVRLKLMGSGTVFHGENLDIICIKCYYNAYDLRRDDHENNS